MHRAVRAVESIEKFKIGDDSNTIYVVVNDSLAVYKQTLNAFRSFTQVRVHHYSEISDYTSARSGWWSQQWLKLSAHQLIASDWYMPFDSDMFINQHVSNSDMFLDNKAFCDLRDIDIYQENTEFIEYIKNACNLWKIDFPINKIMRESPPNLLHRQTVNCMLQQLTPHVFGSYEKPSLEFFVYWAYVIKQNLTNMYQHRDNWFCFGGTFCMDNS